MTLIADSAPKTFSYLSPFNLSQQEITFRHLFLYPRLPDPLHRPLSNLTTNTTDIQKFSLAEMTTELPHCDSDNSMIQVADIELAGNIQGYE
jgi:hypothetical protein